MLAIILIRRCFMYPIMFLLVDITILDEHRWHLGMNPWSLGLKELIQDHERPANSYNLIFINMRVVVFTMSKFFYSRWCWERFGCSSGSSQSHRSCRSPLRLHWSVGSPGRTCWSRCSRTEDGSRYFWVYLDFSDSFMAQKTFTINIILENCH